MKRLKITYLIIIITLSLISLSLYTTYAMFTAGVETEDFVELSASVLPTETKLQEYKRLTINAGESQSILLTIVNSSENNLYYGVWYEIVEDLKNDEVTIAKLSSSVSETSGTIDKDGNEYVKIAIKNMSDASVTVNVGVAYSLTSSLNLPIARTLITDTIQGKYIVNNSVTNGIVSAPTLIVDKGDSITFTVNPNTGYRYKSISCTNASASYNNGIITLSNITDDANCTVINEIITYTVNVSAPNASVSPTSRVINYNGSGTFTVTPNTGYEYSSVSCPNGITGSYSTSNNILTVSSVTNDGTCTVNFKKKTYTVTVNAVNGTASPTSKTVEHGNSTTFTVNPNSGYVYDSISCSGGSYNASNNTLTVSNVTSNRTCTVNFKRNEPQDTSGANAPVLYEGLIPVMHNGTTWVKADSTNYSEDYRWYDYDEAIWANAVLVTDTNRNTYKNATAGTVIPESDILAYYVWIPRYKYKVWNINKVAGTDSYSARTNGIDIVFESGTSSTGTISCSYSFDAPSSSSGTPNEKCTGANGQYYTHPAFTFGSTKLPGIWVGKFEISSSNPSATAGGGIGITLAVRIKPNVTSWRRNPLTSFYYVIRAMSNSDNEYGLSTDSDSHMMKNTEWGVVAYFAHSKYGLCSSGTCKNLEMNGYGIRSGTVTMTGCGPISLGSTSFGATCNAYNTSLGMSASTTGNVYGIYDMSGGAAEYVMANASNTTGSFALNIGRASTDYTFEYNNSTAKYIDTYAYGDSTYEAEAHNRSRLGDATGEVISTVSGSGGWNSNFSMFVMSAFPWFNRGQPFTSSNAGLFAYSSNNGTSANQYSSRAILTAA